MLYDLHCHSTASDGKLTPLELVDRAKGKGVDCLAITDHDTAASYQQMPAQIDGLKLITGIELSTQWRGTGVHIVGLNFDLHSSAISEAISYQQRARKQRAELIAERLAKAGIEETLPGAIAIAGTSVVGRPHFARHLVERGIVKDSGQAFKRYLGSGKLGDVKQTWASLPQVVQWINAAGGIAVLAHPAKYKMTYTKLGLLCDEFVAAGGRGLEVCSGLQPPQTTRDLARLCREKKLLASCGSDFHQPGQHWAELGCCTPLPEHLDPVWSKF